MTISLAINSLAASAGRRATSAPASAGEGFTAEAADAQALPGATSASPPSSGGLIAPSSLAALVQAQTPQKDDDSHTLTGLRLPTPQVGRPSPGGGDLRGRAYTSTSV